MGSVHTVMRIAYGDHFHDELYRGKSFLRALIAFIRANRKDCLISWEWRP